MSVNLKYKIKTAPYVAATIFDIYIKIQSQDESDTNIIMMQVLPKNALDQYQTIFSHIATPVDMQTYPAQYNRDYAYFRTDKAVLRVNSQYQAQSLLKGLAQRVRSLNKALAILDTDQSAQFQDQTGFIDGTNL